MTISRYNNDGVTAGGEVLRSAQAVMRIRAAVKGGTIMCRPIVLRGEERLDKIAGEVYGDGRLWWVIAAASNIGWWMQCPPGTRLWVPVNLSEVAGLI